jgi:hypothetical protein
MKNIFLTIALFMTVSALGADTTALRLNGNSFKAKDTVEFGWDGHVIHKAYPLATMHLWIDNVETGQRWKLRYPIVNGEAAGALAISGDLKPGVYAFNFLAAENYLEIFGKMRKVKLEMAFNHETRKMDTIAVYDQPGGVAQKMEYTLVGRAGILLDSVLNVDDSGRFRIPPMIFGDTARLVFGPEKEKSTYLIDMVTPLDTTFTPFFTKTVFVTIKGDVPGEKTDTSDYHFNFTGNYPQSITMEEILITGNSKVKKFEKEFVSPQFQSINARTLNGLDSDDIMKYNSIWDYLRANTTGMTVNNNGFQRSAMWRGQRVAFFLDEVFVDPSMLNVPPMDIAMIKIYPPPAMISVQAPGGAVAIYTKRGGEEEKRSDYNYIVMGYTQGEIEWK